MYKNAIKYNIYKNRRHVKNCNDMQYIRMSLTVFSVQKRLVCEKGKEAKPNVVQVLSGYVKYVLVRFDIEMVDGKSHTSRYSVIIFD